MAITRMQELFKKLLETTTPSEVKNILDEIGDFADAGLDNPIGKLGLFWHPYGDKTSNYSTIGLASKPGRSITERITNAIDAVLEEHSMRVSTKPNSPQAAVNEWFGRPFSNLDSGLFNWKYSDGNYDRKVGVILNDSGKEEAPTLDILDFGIGISPENFPATILSLHGENKITKKYLVGSFGQGGSSTLVFCEYVFIISRPVENPNTVSFTVIKEIQLGEDYKENCSAYLALKNDKGELTAPSFSLNESINLYETKEKLRLNEFKHGTFVRHYSFRLTNIFRTIGPREGNLYHYLHCSLFDPLIPFQIIDLRNKDSIKQEISTGSRNRLMKLMTKADESELDNSNSKCKLFRPFAFITPYGATSPCVKIEYWVVFNEEKKKNKKTGEEYYNLRSDSNALYVHKKHLAILTLNGQNQGELTVSQVSKDLGLDLVSRHLVIHIDATDAPMNVKRQLFTTNRETLRDGDVLESIKQELRRILSEDPDLKALDNELVEKATSEVTESTDDEVKKQIIKLLREAGFTPSAEGDTIRKGNGGTTDNPPPPPQPPPPPPLPVPPLQTLPYPDVTRFEIVSPKLKMEIHVNKTAIVLVETDADSKYKDEIRIKIEPESLEVSTHFPLYGGRVKWRLKTVENSKVGDKGKITVTLTKPNGDQLKDEIEYEVLQPIEKPSKEEKGFIPDFEVLPINPESEKWNEIWSNISEDANETFAVAYKPIKLGEKTIVYYSTVFSPFRAMADKLKVASSPLYKFFETNYKVWIGYHAILQLNSQNNVVEESDEDKFDKERENERARVAQMQVKQALKSAELMLTLSKHDAAVLSD